MANTNDYIPVNPTHPTEIIVDEMKALGLNRTELASRLGMKLPNLSRMIRNKETITTQMAAKLEAALGIEAEFWLSAQCLYEKQAVAVMERDREENEAVKTESELSKYISLKILSERLGVDGCLFAKDRVAKIYELFGVDRIDGLLSIAMPTGRFRESRWVDSNEVNKNTWVLLAHKVCLNTEVSGIYQKGNAVSAAVEIARMANDETITEKRIKETLGRYGIAYGYEPKIEKVYIDAYSTIIGGKPCIITSHRYNNMDMFVFDVLHELKHIDSDLETDDVNLSTNWGEAKLEDERERIADKFATDTLIPPDVWKKMIETECKTLNPYSVMNVIQRKAKELGISPSIAAWRYKYETRTYNIRHRRSPAIR